MKRSASQERKEARGDGGSGLAETHCQSVVRQDGTPYKQQRQSRVATAFGAHTADTAQRFVWRLTAQLRGSNIFSFYTLR